MPQLTDKKNRFFLYVLAFILLSTVNNIDIFKKQNSTLQIKNIKVSGLSNENNLKVTNDLNSLLFQNILFINKDKVKKILLENNLIELFEVKKNYPNSVQIDLQKTKFIAITINNNHNFFIGSNGKLISYKDTEWSKKIISEATTFIAEGIVNVNSLTGIRNFIIGGSIGLSNNFFREIIKNTKKITKRKILIIKAGLKNNSEVFGCLAKSNDEGN